MIKIGFYILPAIVFIYGFYNLVMALKTAPDWVPRLMASILYIWAARDMIYRK
jgi:hypothetical protein